MADPNSRSKRTRSPGVSAIRRLLNRAAEVIAAARDLREGEERMDDAVRDAYEAYREGEVRRELDTLAVEKLNDVAGARLPIARLRKAGYTNVASVLNASQADLMRVPGVGEQSAAFIAAAAQRIAESAEQGVQITADLDLGEPDAAALLTALYRAQTLDKTLAKLREPARRLGEQLTGLMEAAEPLRGRMSRITAGSQRREQAREAAHGMAAVLDEATETKQLEKISDANRKLRAAPAKPGVVRRHFEQNAVRYFSTLGRIVGAREDAEASRGFMPEDMAGRIAVQELDQSRLKVSLRGYQAFGARFALAQRRVILGDEMGCGKTVEAIAAMAHLSADRDRRHFLVVCPASVLINWMREVTAHSTLRAHRLHGSDRDANIKLWTARGGVGVTTFEAARAVELPHGTRLNMLIVDEAHYVKNPDTQRSQSVRTWAMRAERVLFLTGTPMENRVEEFRNLVGYLQPDLVPAVNDAHGAAGSKAFRKAVAPAYLRRNQEDVLSELPEMAIIDEWEEFGPEDEEAYEDAVAARNFMAMRRAAYASKNPRTSAKLRRLVEINEEARANGRKVVVFSNFRDVLDTVCETLRGDVYDDDVDSGGGDAGGRGSGATAGAGAAGAGAAGMTSSTGTTSSTGSTGSTGTDDTTGVFGPLTGSIPPARRQEMVDAFAAAKGHAVLVSQIQAGGVGLNMQAASVVILCEPQVKPTLETQAVARAHRMGQIRKVQVHRLLVADSVDQRMLELLEEKSQLFDSYARRSELAETTPEALDLGSDAAMSRSIIDVERERLGMSTGKRRSA